MFSKAVVSIALAALLASAASPLLVSASDAASSAADSIPPHWSQNVTYLALGDSLAYGVTPTNTAGLSYADYLAASIQGTGSLVGYEKRFSYPKYTTADVLTDLKANVTKDVYGRPDPNGLAIRDVAKNANLVTLDAGANDLLGLLHQDSVTHSVYLNPEEIQPMLLTVQSNVYQILAELRGLSPKADLYVMGYYNAFPYLSAQEQAGLLTVLDQLNLALKQTAATMGATFVPTKDLIAAKATTYIPSPANIHLSPEGYQAVAGEFWRNIQAGVLWMKSLTATNITTRSAHLAWLPASDNIGVTSYRIYNDASVLATVYASALTVQSSVYGGVYQYDLTGLSPLHTYNLRVEAGDAVGLWSTGGPTVSFRTKDDSSGSTGGSGGTSGGSSGGGSSAGSGGAGSSGTDTGWEKLTFEASDLTADKDVDGTPVTQAAVSKEKLAAALDKLKAKTADQQILMLEAKGSSAAVRFTLPADTVNADLAVASSTVIRFKAGDIEFAVPLTWFKNNAADAANATLSVTLKTLSGSAADGVKQAVESRGLGQLPPGPVDLRLRITGADGKAVELPQPNGGKYAELSLYAAKDTASSTVTALTYNTQTGVGFTPAVFRPSGSGTAASVHLLQAGTVTLATGKKSFKDVQSHWSAAEVESLASKLLIQGVSDNAFAPDKEVTRAEFAALLVRALGLPDRTAASKYSDVPSGHWAAGAIGAAAEAGLIEGFEDGSFKPSASITRGQMAVLLAKALRLAGKPVKLPETAETNLMSRFKDRTQIPSWAKESAAQSVEAGLLQGYAADQFGAQEIATRAQAATVLKRLLVYVGFIN
ncbi:S-layer homology domain-containing protein [Paenibacillus filicis]|uniref:S-layer homology domain-containing protein n=1 Tax=Paenibacillus gyeongsangnamensis TaxID=3388067 RepID=A0ABT4QCY7_9BACL|nr:S-layer homology domain-containing protein [Paenibacillus filicis]MCZ8514736.1 S-layer homology domain-containing protein [Paenibacillus filicis]